MILNTVSHNKISKNLYDHINEWVGKQLSNARAEIDYYKGY
jgi:hypothetical protein